MAFGGRVEPWSSPAGPAFQVTTELDRLPVVLPPSGAFSQAMELWTSAGLARRCDGQALVDGSACQCPADPGDRRDQAKLGAACAPVTRLSVLLPDVPGVGVWTLTSRGWAAAAELGGMAGILEGLAAAGRMVPAELRLERREKRVPGQPTKHFIVPVLEVPELRLAELMVGGPALGQIGPGHVRQMPQLPAPAGGSAVGASPLLPGATRADDGADAGDVVILCGDEATGFLEGETCVLDAGHAGVHRSAAESSWPALAGSPA
jgi:hypothetical protein